MNDKSGKRRLQIYKIKLNKFEWVIPEKIHTTPTDGVLF